RTFVTGGNFFHNFISDFGSCAAMRLASATSSGVLTLKNGSIGVVGQAATATPRDAVQLSTLRAPSLTNARRKSERKSSGHNATTGCRLCADAAHASGALAS